MAFPLLGALLISVAISAVSYLIMPKPKGPKPEQMREMDSPTAEAGIAIPVIFGEVEIHAPNVMWHGDKSTATRKI